MGSASPVKQPFITSTTVDDLSNLEKRLRNAIQSVDTGWRSLNTLKGRGEAVWPPLLEAALLKALEMYPTEVVGSKSDQSFGRSPMRNRFISEYIYKTTGERRTSHQVVHHLRRLWYTCVEEKIIQLQPLSHRNIGDAGSSSQSESSLGAPVSPSPPPDFFSVEKEHTYVKIPLQGDLRPAPPPTIQLVSTNTNHPQSIQLSPTLNPPSGTISQNKSNIPSYLYGTTESLYAEGSTSPIHSGVASLRYTSSPTQRSGWPYNFDLVPSFWDSLCTSRDVTRHTIVQTPEPAHPNPSNDFDGANRNLSVVYRFEASESRPQEISPVHDTSTTLAPDSTPLMPCDYSKETNHRCTGPTSTMIQGSEITIQGGKLTNVGRDCYNYTCIMKYSTTRSKYLRAKALARGRKKLSASDNNNEKAAPSRRFQGEVDRTLTAAEFAQDEGIDHTTFYRNHDRSAPIVGPANLGTLSPMDSIDEPLCGVGKDFQRYNPKKSTKTTSNTGEQAAPSMRSRVENEDDMDDEFDTIANVPYDQPTEIKFSSLDDPPSTSASEPGTTPDNEYYIYQTPPPTNRQLLVFVPGVLHYLPCWFWLPSLTGFGQWVASWTATWATPPCWMPSFFL